jgi:hypothetical protein
LGSAVNEQRYPVGYQYPDHCHNRAGPGCKFHPVAMMPEHLASVDRVVLYHYCTKSLEDYKIKSSRAGGNNPVGKPMSFYYAIEKCERLCYMLLPEGCSW